MISAAQIRPPGSWFRRSVKILAGIRLNFGKRGISTSIGVRGANVTFGSSGTRTTVGLPGSGLSYTHLDGRQRALSTPTSADPRTNPELTQGSAQRGYMSIGLMVAFLVIGIGRLRTPALPVPQPAPMQTPAEIAAKTAAQTARDERLAEIRQLR